jgi:hypothetical protein
MMVWIKYNASPLRRRIMGPHEWTPENDHLCEVSVELAADLLTYPSGGFELAQDLDEETAVELAALVGVDAAEL